MIVYILIAPMYTITSRQKSFCSECMSLLVNAIYEFGYCKNLDSTLWKLQFFNYTLYKATKDSEELDKYKLLITLPMSVLWMVNCTEFTVLISKFLLP